MADKTKEKDDGKSKPISRGNETGHYVTIKGSEKTLQIGDDRQPRTGAKHRKDIAK